MNKKNTPFIVIILVLGLILFSYLVFNSTKETEINANKKDTPISNTDFNTLVWSDEFNKDGAVNSEKWFHQTQLPPGGNWYGGLIQHYTNRKKNSFVKNGLLNLVAKKEQFDHQDEIKEYTSARLNSKFSFTYGRVEIRAKLPRGIGTWPAIWMLSKSINEDGAYWDNKGFGKTNWPNCGEIDILEHWGENQNEIQSAVHTASSFGYYVKNKGGQIVSEVSNQFHRYTLVWTKEKIIFDIDGIEHYRYNPTLKNDDTWPFDSDYYFLMNIAIEPNIDSNFIESTMEVDYIRVF
jgi:beta-glucanase (GH16 family)